MVLDRRLWRGDWSLRSSEFTKLLEYNDGGNETIAAMVFKPVATRSTTWDTTRGVWLDLRPHPNLLDALEVRGHGVILRYAAIHWRHGRSFGERGQQQLATWGIQIADALRTALVGLAGYRVGWLTNPFVKFDLGGQARIGFLSAAPDILAASSMAPEVKENWPRCTERGLVFTVGALLRQLSVESPSAPIDRLIGRAAANDPSMRHPTLSALQEDLASAGGNAASIRHGNPLAAWTAAEAGMGMLALKRQDRALALFEQALDLDRDCALARWGRNELRHANAMRSVPSVIVQRDWLEVEPEARALEARGLFKEAFDRYHGVDSRTVPGNALLLALARCHLAFHDTGHALDYARRALAIAPETPEALAIERRALLARSEFAQALARADTALAARPDDAEALYVRGRALLGLRRLVEARDAFEAVLVRCPTMIAAMLLRREADRMLIRVRAVVGVQELAPTREDYLASIRAYAMEGRTSEAIEELSAPEHAEDPTAQLLLAECLLTEHRDDEALAVYVRVAQAGGEHREAAAVGTGLALLALGRSAEALEMLELALKRWPENLDALEGYAQALEATGRADEAEAAHRRATAARAARSDVRLRTLA